MPSLGSHGGGGDLFEVDVMCKTFKHVEHPVGDQFVPIHLPENIPPVENNNVSEFSGEMEFSGGPTEFFEVSVCVKKPIRDFKNFLRANLHFCVTCRWDKIFLSHR